MPRRGRARGRLALGALCVALSLGVVGRAAASNVDLFGLGARGGALAGIIAAAPEGHEATYYNPAGLALHTRPSFALGVQSAHYQLDFDGDRRDIDAAPATVIGVSVPIPFGGVLAHRVTIGLSFVLPLTSLLTADIPRPAEPRFVVMENRGQTVSIQGAVGVRIADWLSIGGGTLALAELMGAIDVAPNQTGRIGAQVRDEVVADYALFAGAIVQPHETLSLSIAFRDESDARFELPITVDLGPGFDIPIPLLDVAGTAQYDPRQLAVDIAVRAIPGWLMGVGVTWKQWSRFRNPIVYTAVPDDYPPQPEPDFTDIFVVRAGAEHTLEFGSGWSLVPRLGLTWEPSPVPAQTGLHNYLDSDKFVFAGGCGTAWENLRAATALQVHWLPEGSSTKSDERLAVEQLAAPEENPGYPTRRHGGTVLYWIVEVGATF